MAKKSGLAQEFYIGGRDLSGDVAAISLASTPRETTEIQGIDKSAVERLMTRASGMLEFATWFNDATDQEHDALKGLPTADILVLWAMGGAIGDAAFAMVAKQINYDWARSQDKSLQGMVRCENAGVAPEWCALLTPGNVTHTAAANGASLDNAAASSNGLVGHLHVTAFAGTTITVVVQESSDDGVGDPFTTKLSFAAVTADDSSERTTATGTVERYLRVSSSGTFTSADFVVAVRRGTAQDDEAY